MSISTRAAATASWAGWSLSEALLVPLDDAGPVIDLFVPDSALDSEAERDLVDRLTTIMLKAEGAWQADEAVLAGSWVFLHHAHVTDLIWKNAHIDGFRYALFTPEQINAANATLLDLLAKGDLHPQDARTFPLDQAAQAQRHLTGDRPFGRVLLAI
ncbi:zinc-binding dehydrogenase [Streptomyces wedmorensis]|uniref:zinc-binding dehydrogenase n=1 Tax=Streptomyces wedmorensis TaxID=43759 RepID=UPI0005266CA8|nr:zinc-binding dehydrogenase [Streptomyces wedmorensis]